jgi:nitroreductase
MTTLLTRTPAHTALVADAVRAPSSHNTQPWLFRTAPDRVELHADRTRALPVNDPHDRELLMSCGAALTNLCAAARHHHYSTRVEVLPGDDPDHLATVHLTPAPAYTDTRIAYGIRLRGTWRKEFTGSRIPESVVGEMVEAAEAHDAWAHVVTDDERQDVVDLVRRGDHTQFDDASWRRELAAWMHPRRTGDGLVVPMVSGPMTRFVVSHVDIGDRVARADADLTESAPLVVVIGTDTDDEAAWLAAGQALQSLLLTGAVVGVQAGFVNQPCQVAELRAELAELVGRPFPQVLVRLGYTPEQPAESPRRPVEDVMIA